MATKRLWTNEELIAIGTTVDILRRMRSAAVMDRTTVFFKIEKALRGWSGEIASSQEILLLAEELADAAGDYFAARIVKTNRRELSEKWYDLLSDAKKLYRQYKPTTFAGTNLEEAGFSVISRLRNLHIDPDYSLQWDLLQNNRLGATSIEKLLQQNIGIISPLSGDYLMASTYNSYLWRTKRKFFPLRAAALSKDLSTIILPIDTKDNPLFKDQLAIGCYIDTTETGRTALALFEAMRQTYPEKTVIEPNFEKTEFIPSRRMEQYWKRRQYS